MRIKIVTGLGIGLLNLVLLSSAVAQQPLPAKGNEAELIAVLNSDAQLFDKAKACQRLAVIGTAKSVPALTQLLNDPQLSHYARLGLESNPSPEVDAALREALANMKGELLVGVINTIGVRRDAKAASPLQELATSEDDAVASAALAALGAIASAESISTIQSALGGRDALRVPAADACLTAADTLLNEGKNADAAELLAAVRMAELPKHINIASRFGEIRAEAENTNDLMAKYLASEDNDLFRIGLELAHGLKDEATTQQLLKQMESFSGSRRMLLIYVLGDRGDDSALPAVLAAVKDEDEDLRVAAMSVLGTLGDRSVLDVLIDGAGEGSDAIKSAALQSLMELEGEDVDKELTARLLSSQGEQRLVLVTVVGQRGVTDAVPTLLKYTSASDSQLRRATIDALGMTVGLDELPELVDLLMKNNSSAVEASLRDALQKACQRMPDRDQAAGILLNRMDRASTADEGKLMNLLIYVGGKRALEGVGSAAKGRDDSAADAATQTLGKWLTPDAAPVLLELATEGNRKYRVRCLRGYIRIIRQFGLKDNQRLQMSKSAYAAATRDEERKLVLDTITRFPTRGSLSFAVSQLRYEPVKEDAAKAAVAISDKLVDRDAPAVAVAMPKVMAASRNSETDEQARQLLERAKR